MAIKMVSVELRGASLVNPKDTHDVHTAGDLASFRITNLRGDIDRAFVNQARGAVVELLQGSSADVVGTHMQVQLKDRTNGKSVFTYDEITSGASGRPASFVLDKADNATSLYLYSSGISDDPNDDSQRRVQPYYVKNYGPHPLKVTEDLDSATAVFLTAGQERRFSGYRLEVALEPTDQNATKAHGVFERA